MPPLCREGTDVRAPARERAPQDRSQAASERAARVERLRRAIAAGAYRPTAHEVAATLLWALQGRRVAASEH